MGLLHLIALMVKVCHLLVITVMSSGAPWIKTSPMAPLKQKKKKPTLALLTFSAARCPHEVFHSVKVKRKFLDVGLKGIKLKGSKMSDWFRVFNPCGINLKKASGAITRSKFHVSFTSPVSLLTAHGHLSKVQSSGPSVSMNNILNSCQLCHKRTT